MDLETLYLGLGDGLKETSGVFAILDVGWVGCNRWLVRF